MASGVRSRNRTIVEAEPTISRGPAYSNRTHSALRTGSLSDDPRPIKGAPPRGETASMASSVPTDPARNEEDSDADEDASAKSSHPSMAGGGRMDPKEQDEKFQVIQALSADLIRATEQLHQRLQNGTYDNRVFATLRSVARDTLESLMEACMGPEGHSFVDFEWLMDFGERRGTITSSVILTLARANVVHALDEIERVRLGPASDALSLLEPLDAVLPYLLVTPSERAHHEQMALAVRTHHLIERLAAQRGKVDVRKVFASVFCGVVEHDNYPHLLSHGPYLSLTHRGLAEEPKSDGDDPISSRVTKLYQLASKDPKGHGISSMRAQFPMKDLLDDLRAWCLEQYAAMSSATSAQDVDAVRNETQESEDVFEDAAEERKTVTSSQASPARSLQRGPPDQKARQLSSLQIAGNHAKEWLKQNLVLSESDEPSQQLQVHPSNKPSRSTQQRQQSEQRPIERPHVSGPETEDEENNDFQTDTTQRNLATFPYPPRASNALAHRSDSPPSSSQILARRRHILHPPPSSAPSSSRYASILPIERQRHGWSEKDKDTLLRLIHLTNASWAAIQKEYNTAFDWPRNQQAYRDKARNMKVDYLLNDLPLPLGFDGVALGRKEIQKVLSMGKNPRRRVADLDDDGRPTCTDIIDDQYYE